MRRLLVLLAISAALACKPAPEPPARETSAPKPRQQTLPAAKGQPDEDDNLLNLVFGAGVVSRNSELNLESSVVLGIDGSPITLWTSAPGGGNQVAVFSFPAPARLTHLGVTTLAAAADRPERIRYSTSADGREWKEVLTFMPRESSEPQLTPVSAEGQYLRVETFEEKDYYTSIGSLNARGRLLAPPAQPPLAGCWTVNGLPAYFVKSGARVAGVIGDDPPTFLEGGTDGRVYRLMWLRKAQWGYAAITVTPDGSKLSGVRWHEEVNPFKSGEAYFGERGSCSGHSLDDRAVVEAILLRAGRWSLYGVRFDERDRIAEAVSRPTLDLAASVIRGSSLRLRIVSHEYREATPELNAKRSAARLEPLRAALKRRGVDLSRLDFVAAGDTQRHELAVDYTTQRVMDSRVELQAAAKP